MESVTDPTTLAIAAQTGEVDAILSAGAQQVQQLADGGTMTVQYPEPANQYFLRLNTRIAPTDNAVFRQALNHAVDRRAIATLTGQQVAPSTGPLPRGNEAYQEDPGAAADSYDPEEARRLIRESGVPTPVRLRMLAPDSGPGFSQATEIMSLIQQDLKAVGVQLDTQYMEFASLVAEEGNGYNDTTHGSFNGWTTGADAADFLERMFSGELHPPTASTAAGTGTGTSTPSSTAPGANPAWTAARRSTGKPPPASRPTRPGSSSTRTGCRAC